jgi:hypothetical protein
VAHSRNAKRLHRRVVGNEIGENRPEFHRLGREVVRTCPAPGVAARKRVISPTTYRATRALACPALPPLPLKLRQFRIHAGHEGFAVSAFAVAQRLKPLRDFLAQVLAVGICERQSPLGQAAPHEGAPGVCVSEGTLSREGHAFME